mgnify:CR=1 FL=1
MLKKLKVLLLAKFLIKSLFIPSFLLSISFSFFNKLDRLNNGDNIYVYYNGKKYEYKLNNHYEIN